MALKNKNKLFRFCGIVFVWEHRNITHYLQVLYPKISTISPVKLFKINLQSLCPSSPFLCFLTLLLCKVCRIMVRAWALEEGRPEFASCFYCPLWPWYISSSGPEITMAIKGFSRIECTKMHLALCLVPGTVSAT